MHKSFEELEANLEAAEQVVEAGAYYRHYKDPASRYQVLGFTILEADDSVCVRYRSIIDAKVEFIRPLADWLEEVDGRPRFELID